MRKYLCVSVLVIISFAGLQNVSGQAASVEAPAQKEEIVHSFIGYFNITDIGLLIGSPQNQNPAAFSFMTFNGAHITEQLSASLGIGVEFPSGSYMPMVLDARYYLRNTSFSPFFQLYGGYALPLDDSYNQGYWYGVPATSSSMPYYEEYKPYVPQGGWLVNPGFGIRSIFGENFGVVFSVGYRVQRLYYQAGDDHRRIVDYNRLALKIGITFR